MKVKPHRHKHRKHSRCRQLLFRSELCRLVWLKPDLVQEKMTRIERVISWLNFNLLSFAACSLLSIPKNSARYQGHIGVGANFPIRKTARASGVFYAILLARLSPLLC